MQNKDSIVRYKDIAAYLIINNRFDDVLEMARNNKKLYSGCSQSVQEMVKSGKTDSALAKHPNQKKEILKECICQNKNEEALNTFDTMQELENQSCLDI